MSILLAIITVASLTLLAAICSGLNIALMSLNLDDLRRKKKLGNANAKKVYPFRKNTHLTLAAILLTNVAAVSTTSIFLESVTYGLLAGVITTLLMVVFGEILPQAYFAPRALHFMARLAPMLRLMIVVTYPVSKPIQLLLDRLFGHQRSRLHTRRELGVMITEHLGHEESELDEDEVEIIRGALQLSEKKVSDIMLPVDDVYWLTPDTELTTDIVRNIKKVGRSRIPVFNEQLTHCYGLLLMKDLIDINFKETGFRVGDLGLHAVQLVGSRTALDTLLRKFMATSTHLIPVVRDEKIVGIATIEDLIEEIVGQEIEDESEKRRAQAEGSA